MSAVLSTRGYARGVGPATADVSSTFSPWCHLWFHICQVLNNLYRQCFIFKVCSVPVRFGICSPVSARTSLLSAVCPVFWLPWHDQCSQQTSGTVVGAQCQCCVQCLQWAQLLLLTHSLLAPAGLCACCVPPAPNMLLAWYVLCDRSPWCGQYKLPDAFAIYRSCCIALVVFLLFSLCLVPDASSLWSGTMLCAHC